MSLMSDSSNFQNEKVFSFQFIDSFRVSSAGEIKSRFDRKLCHSVFKGNLLFSKSFLFFLFSNF